MITRWPPVNTLTRRPTARVCQAGWQRLNGKLSLGFQNGAWLADLRVFLLRWPRGWQDRGLVTERMLYLILIRMVGWMALLARCAAADDAGLLVLR